MSSSSCSSSSGGGFTGATYAVASAKNRSVSEGAAFSVSSSNAVMTSVASAGFCERSMNCVAYQYTVEVNAGFA